MAPEKRSVVGDYDRVLHQEGDEERVISLDHDLVIRLKEQTRALERQTDERAKALEKQTEDLAKALEKQTDERFNRLEKQLTIGLNALQNIVTGIKCPGSQCDECFINIKTLDDRANDHDKDLTALKTQIVVQWAAIGVSYVFSAFVLTQLFGHVQNSATFIISHMQTILLR